MEAEITADHASKEAEERKTEKAAVPPPIPEQVKSAIAPHIRRYTAEQLKVRAKYCPALDLFADDIVTGSQAIRKGSDSRTLVWQNHCAN